LPIFWISSRFCEASHCNEVADKTFAVLPCHHVLSIRILCVPPWLRQEAGAEAGEGPDVDLRLARLEALMERRPELVSSVLLRQNPHNVHEWHKRVKLFAGDPTRQILTYTEAVKTVDPLKALGKPHTLWVDFAKLYEKHGDLPNARVILEKATQVRLHHDLRQLDQRMIRGRPHVLCEPHNDMRCLASHLRPVGDVEVGYHLVTVLRDKHVTSRAPLSDKHLRWRTLL
jgi:hypothetical protein